MTLRIKFILFVVVVHATLLLLTFHFLKTNTWLFLASEVLILVSGVLSFQIYRSFVRPLQLIAAGWRSSSVPPRPVSSSWTTMALFSR